MRMIVSSHLQSCWEWVPGTVHVTFDFRWGQTGHHPGLSLALMTLVEGP
jgi:hypothetical protein